MTGAQVTYRRFVGPALVACALLSFGYGRLAEGTKHPSPWGYRLWSFEALAYSDIIALHEDRNAARHALPYLHDRIEYPVLLGVGMWWPSVIAPSREGYFGLSFFALALCGLAVLWIIAALPGTNPWAFGASPALLVYAGLNWDLFALLPLAAGIWLWLNGRERWGVAVLGLAVWTKFFPILILGVLLLASRKRALELALVFVAVSLVVNLPFVLFARDNWLWFFQLNSMRDVEQSVYLLFGVNAHAFAPSANLISALLTAAAAGALAIVQLRTKRLDPLKAACALVCVFFLVNKVFSPQYWLWVVALVALASVPVWLATAISAAALVDYVVIFTRLHLQAARIWPALQWYEQHVFLPSIAVRCALLAGCAAWAFARCVRPAAAPAV